MEKRKKGLGFRDSASRHANREVPEELDRIQYDPGNARLENDCLLRLPERDVGHVRRQPRLDLAEDLRTLRRIRCGRLRLDQPVHGGVVIPVPEGPAATGGPMQEREDVVVGVEVVWEPSEEEDVELSRP